MHSTEGKHDACQTPAWERKSAPRVCEHGDSRYKGSVKRTAAKARRSQDKREARREPLGA